MLGCVFVTYHGTARSRVELRFPRGLSRPAERCAKTSLDRVLFVPASEWRARRGSGAHSAPPTGCVLVCVRVPTGPPCYGAPRPPERVFRSSRRRLSSSPPCPFLSAPPGVRKLLGLERLRTLGARNCGPGRLRLLCGRAVMSTRASLLGGERLRVDGFPGLSKACLLGLAPRHSPPVSISGPQLAPSFASIGYRGKFDRAFCTYHISFAAGLTCRFRSKPNGPASPQT